MVRALRATANDCWARVAGAYVEFPAWSPLTVHVPAPVNETVAPDTVHTPRVADENVTGFPEPPPVAAGEYDPPYIALAGAGDGKVIVCGAGATDTCCVAVGAGA